MPSATTACVTSETHYIHELHAGLLNPSGELTEAQPRVSI